MPACRYPRHAVNKTEQIDTLPTGDAPAQLRTLSGEQGVTGGFVVGAILVAMIARVVFRFGVRLPLSQFFGISAVVMMTLAIIFAGKGIVALQKAGKVPASPVNFPRIGILEVYPTWQSPGIQLGLLTSAIVLILYSQLPRRAEGRVSGRFACRPGPTRQ